MVIFPDLPILWGTLIVRLTQQIGPSGPCGGEADANPGSLGMKFSQMVTLASVAFRGVGWHSSSLISLNISQQGIRVGNGLHVIIQINIGSFSLG